MACPRRPPMLRRQTTPERPIRSRRWGLYPHVGKPPRRKGHKVAPLRSPNHARRAATKGCKAPTNVAKDAWRHFSAAALGIAAESSALLQGGSSIVHSVCTSHKYSNTASCVARMPLMVQLNDFLG